MLAFVGSLNRAGTYPGTPTGVGVSVLSFDEATGLMQPLSEARGVDNPTFLAPSGDARTLYVTSEVEGWGEGVVTAFHIGAEGRLTYINQQPTWGSIAAQAIIHPSGRWLLVANYRSGTGGVRPPQSVAVLPIEADGGLGPVAHTVAHAGSGPDPTRQDGPHPHCLLATPDGAHVLVADLGIDRLIAYQFDPATGVLRAAAEVAMPAGTGPRHLAWVRPGLLVVTGELDNTVTSLAWTGAAAPTIIARISTLPDGFSGESHASDIHASADGRFVYAANRGHDSLVVLAIDPDGHMAQVGHHATGRIPRQFTMGPGDRVLLVACQSGDELRVFHRDAPSGRLSEPPTTVAIGSPMCVRLVS